MEKYNEDKKITKKTVVIAIIGSILAGIASACMCGVIMGIENDGFNWAKFGITVGATGVVFLPLVFFKIGYNYIKAYNQEKNKNSEK